MKPVSIRFKGFGPYVQEQFIDFTLFEKSGLFLICGETGAGKTTILDAMCMALFGRSSGSKPGDLDKMRCKLCAKEDETLVEFIFDADGRRYKFLRRGIYKTKNFNEDHKCFEIKENVEVLISEKKSQVNQKAEELMGLTCDQFRQVVILPQGEFEKLLTSKSEEKEAILTSLFHAERWSHIAEFVADQVSKRAKVLAQEKMRMETKLAEYKCADPEGLSELLAQELAALEEDEQKLLQFREQLRLRKEAYEAALLENRDFEELSRRQTAALELEKKQQAAVSEARILEQAEAARGLEPIHAALLESRETVRRGEQAAERAASRRCQAQKAAEAAKAARLAHDTHREEYLQNSRKITLLEDARPLYSALGQKRSQVLQLERALALAQKMYDRMAGEYDTAYRKWEEETAHHDEILATYQRIQEGYRKGIRGLLAEELEEGTPCPVCGSLTHPHPAPLGERISDADVDRWHKAMEQQISKVKLARESREQAERRREDARKALEEASRTYGTAKAELETMVERMVPGIRTEEDLERAVSSLKNQVWAFETRENKTNQDLMDTAAALSVAMAEEEKTAAELLQLREELQAKALSWKQALEESPFETEETFRNAVIEPALHSKRKEALIRYFSALEAAEAALAEQQKLLEGREKPDVAELKKQRNEAESLCKSLGDRLVVRRNVTDRMRRDLEDLQHSKADYDEKRIKLDADQEFADRLRGVRGVSLRRYVLGVMLTSITTAANQLLKNVHSGRYQLFRTDQSTGRTMKAGLELEVYDSQNNERRSVTTLSGGEKFLVALSLAIGLSAVVQAQGHGMRLEAMFIDEGFGSLDRESVGDALEVLQGIQRSHGIVGIISHVDQLSETIPAKIRILKSEKGSTCRVCL